MLSVVSAAGDITPVLFVFKGARIPYREIIVDDAVHFETVAYFLPRDALVCMRSDVSGVDADIFHQFAIRFTESVKNLTSGGRHVLLTYDACRSHMSLRTLLHFQSSNVIVYAIPSNTSGKLQTCDTGLFGALKMEVNQAISDVAMPKSTMSIDIFQLCSLTRHAFYRSFTRHNIESSFRKARMWPVDRYKLLNKPRPYGNDLPERTISVVEMEEMFLKKREEARRLIVGDTVITERKGFVDTTRGLVLTTEKCLDLVRAKSQQYHENKRKKVMKLKEKQKKEQNCILRPEKAKWVTRASLARMPLEEFRASVRPMSILRDIARARARKRTRDDAVSGLLGLTSDS